MSSLAVLLIVALISVYAVNSLTLPVGFTKEKSVWQYRISDSAMTMMRITTLAKKHGDKFECIQTQADVGTQALRTRDFEYQTIPTAQGLYLRKQREQIRYGVTVEYAYDPPVFKYPTDKLASFQTWSQYSTITASIVDQKNVVTKSEPKVVEFITLVKTVGIVIENEKYGRLNCTELYQSEGTFSQTIYWNDIYGPVLIKEGNRTDELSVFI